MDLKNKLWNIINERKSDIVRLCSEMIRIPSDNPPGYTAQIADYLKEYLEQREIKVDLFEPLKGSPNLVATIKGSKPGPHLILNGHLDQFPAEVGEVWSVKPYSGSVIDGKIYGRGAGDMKGGNACLITSFCLIKEMELDLPGKVTLTLVSDEENGGLWGTGWLIDNVEDAVGDACLNAEPSGLTARVGEKGLGFIRLKAVGKPVHAAYVGYAGENAIMKMMNVLPVVESLNGLPGIYTDETRKLIENSQEGFYKQSGHEAGPGSSQVLKQVTVNIGTIRGGSKVNIIPGTCEVEVDVRLPLGISWPQFEKELEERLNQVDSSITWEHIKQSSTLFPASFTSINEDIFKAMYSNATRVMGENPLLGFTPGGNDCRYYRAQSIPSVVFGPTVYNEAAADEYTNVKDLIIVTKVHMGTIIDYQTKKLNML
jgi:succinyl-diaminopimelate desuccinylase